MIKSWADHCSSDEESDDGMHHPARGEIPTVAEGIEEEYEDDYLHEDGGLPEPMQLDFTGVQLPTQPPFTAYLRNLNFKIRDEQTLADEVQRLADSRYRMLENKDLIHVLGARFGMDRNTGSRKGYGYVDVENVEELKLLLSLNDGLSVIMDRPVKIELAQSSRNKKSWNSRNNRENQTVPDVDGSAFQGGRFANRDKKNQNNNHGRDKKDTSPRQRPTLQLKPRTVPAHEESTTGSSSRSNIFGRARPRNENSTNKNTTTDGASSQSSANKTKNLDSVRSDSSNTDSVGTEHKMKGGRTGSNNNGRGSRGRSDSKDYDRRHKDAGNRGGRGRNRGGGSKVGGKGDDKKDNSAGRKKTGAKGNPRSNEKSTTDNSSKKPANSLPVQKTEEKKNTKSLNAFAALGFDSDSD